MKLTPSNVKQLALPPGVVDKVFWDDDVGGFGLRLRAGGSASYIVQYDLGGKSRRVTLGPVTLLDNSAARAKAKDLLAQVRLGGDPGAEKRERRSQAAETFGALLKRYFIMQQRAVRQSSYEQTERRLLKLASPLHPLPLTTIDRRTLSALLGSVADDRGPTAAVNLHSSLSGYLGWLVGEGLLDQNPMLGVNKPRSGPARDRVISESELRTLWAALGDDDYGDIVKLLIYTGCRRDEIGGLEWSELDLDAAKIDLPATRMKNGKPFLLPLSGAALAILQKRERNGRVHVFGQNGFQDWSRSRAKLDQAIGGERPNWTLHDLRRTFSTSLNGQLNVSPHLVERLLAHIPAGVSATYNRHQYADEKKRALERWAAYVDAVVTGQPASAQVVQLRR